MDCGLYNKIQHPGNFLKASFSSSSQVFFLKGNRKQCIVIYCILSTFKDGREEKERDHDWAVVMVREMSRVQNVEINIYALDLI